MGRTRLLSAHGSLTSVILWCALVAAALFFFAGCSVSSSHSKHKDEAVSVNWKNGIYTVDEENLDSVVELLRDIYNDDEIISAAVMPKVMIAFYTRRCKQEYGPTSEYAAEIHRENKAQFMCYKMHPRTLPGIKAMCQALGMRMVKGSHQGWKFSCVPTT